MSQIIQRRSPVLAAVTDFMGYVKARKEVERLSKENNLRVADMPMLIRAMSNHPEVRETIRPKFIDTITGEYHGQRDSDRSYEAWHSVGSLATMGGLEKASSSVGKYGFFKIGDDEWVAVGKGNYDGQDVARVHLEDLKKGMVPAAGTSYTVFVRLDKDNPNINNRGQLDYDAFMRDDRVLMVTGSPDSRLALAKMLFDAKKDGGEGWGTVGSYHRINDVGFDTNLGRLVYLNYGSHGLNGSLDLIDDGRFVGVAPEALGVARSARENGNSELGPYRTPGVVQGGPALDDVLRAVEPLVASINKERLEAELRKVYNQ